MKPFKFLVSLVLLLTLIGYTVPDSIRHTTQFSQVTIYTKYEKHETKGRGTLIGYSQGKTYIITARHVVDNFEHLISIEIVDYFGERYIAHIYKFYKNADLAVLTTPVLFSSNLVVKRISKGDKVFTFDLTETNRYSDPSIPDKVVEGETIEDSRMQGWPWITNIILIKANYVGREGMSGGGVFDSKGNLVGVHFGIDGAGHTLFTPVIEAMEGDK